jgi:hypothetical protein
MLAGQTALIVRIYLKILQFIACPEGSQENNKIICNNQNCACSEFLYGGCPIPILFACLDFILTQFLNKIIMV